MATVFAQLAADAAAFAANVAKARTEVQGFSTAGPPDDWWERFFPRAAVPNPLDPSNRGPMRDPFAGPLLFDPRGRGISRTGDPGGGGGRGGGSSGGVGRTFGAGSQRGAEERALVDAWRAYHSASVAAGVARSRIMNYNDWLAAGQPSAEFRFGGELGPRTFGTVPGDGIAPDAPLGPSGDRGRFGSGGGGAFNVGGGGRFDAPTSGPRSPGFRGESGAGIPQNVFIPGVGGGSAMRVSDPELKALHNTIKNRGGIL